MSSFPQNGSSIKSPWTKEDKEGIYSCAECGKHEVRWVTSDCLLLDGTFVPNLERLQCASCGANMFDMAAMKLIRETRARSSQTKNGHKRTQRRILEPENA